LTGIRKTYFDCENVMKISVRSYLDFGES